ncbi:relaxin-3b [Anguilla anguilla]|uniref:relaxin-3b n=1 Tax=Anguilla anguilla TaxID=7936 RepID=UPI0015AF74EC|nr:relaxin-3b [Anguilla anguilla]
MIPAEATAVSCFEPITNLPLISTPGALSSISLRSLLRPVSAMWKVVVLAVSVLAAGTCAKEAQPEFGVKLCGREFIRAVIFTCGGSRWRRAVTNDGDASHNPFSALHDETTGMSPNSVPGRPGPQLQHAAAPDWPREGEEALSFSRPGRSATLEDVLEALRSTGRRERDVVVGLSNACCKWGCSKNEISSLC